MDLTWWDIAPTIVAGLAGVLGVQVMDSILVKVRRKRGPRWPF
jgi:hypothetical protein